MKEKIKQNLNLWLGIFILLQPILDFITGLGMHVFHMNITLGIIVRVLFLLFMMFITVFVYHKKKALFCYISVLIYFILYLLGTILWKDNMVLFSEIQGFIRVFYFPLLLFSFYELKEEIKISKMTLFATSILYLGFIFIPILFDVGYQSYQITKSGTLGFFNSANEISGVISILIPVMFLVLKEKKNLIAGILLSIVFFVVILTMGTKTPLLAFLITSGFVFLYFLIHIIKEKKYKLLVPIVGVIIIGGAGLYIMIPKTNFYKNIQTHLDFLKVKDVSDVFENEHLIDHFIFSQRLTFLKNRQEIYQDESTYQKLIGIGYTNQNKTSKLVEMDYFDIYYSHGLIGFLLFFSIYGYVLIQCLKRKSKITFEKYMVLVSVFLILLLSLFTGHIITAPSVSLLAAIMIISLSTKKKKELLFTSYNLGLGGIETSLVNLLKQINPSKYQVTLLLEKKEGIFLSSIPKYVQVKEFPVSDHQNVIIRKLLNMMRRFFFELFSYHTYDFSCCYATYSLSGNRLSKIASSNSCIYVHSNYRYIYPEELEFKNFFTSRKIHEFQTIVFVANEARTDFVKIYPELESKTCVFNNFIDVDKVKKQSLEKVSIKKNKKKKTFVFVGRLDERDKKVGRAIHLALTIPEIELWIVGDGPARENYEKRVRESKIEDRVQFFGKQMNPYPYMRKADYLILTSDYEGFPVTYLEAIILELPIITTIDVSDDSLNIGESFASIVSKDESKMEEQVKEILKHPKKIEKVDLKKIQKKRIQKLEMLWDEVK